MKSNVTFNTNISGDIVININNRYRTMIAKPFISDLDKWILTDNKDMLNKHIENLIRKGYNSTLSTKKEVLLSLAKELNRIANNYISIANSYFQ